MKEIPLNLTAQTAAGIRTNCFSNTVLFLTEVLRLEIVLDEKEKEFVRFRLPSGEFLEVFGSKNLWHPFTDIPDWEVIIADVRNRKTSAV
jgi:hypothetical protein